MAEDWIEELLRQYQDAITRGVYEGIYRLDEQARASVLACQGRVCCEEFVKLYDIPAELDLETFLARMATGGPSRIRIQRDGDTILWEELHEGQCMCPLVKRGVVPLQPELCACAVHWLRLLLERHARRSAKVELLESVARGSENCVFRVTLGE